jgi:uncharacterized membrane protein YcfT
MLWGIVLHAAMSFFPVPWAVQDTRQSGLFGLLFVLIHGFRMPLFFLLSGYFTLLVYRRRGLATLLQQRAIAARPACGFCVGASPGPQAAPGTVARAL